MNQEEWHSGEKSLGLGGGVKISLYRIAGIYCEDFNLANWRIFYYALNYARHAHACELACLVELILAT